MTLPSARPSRVVVEPVRPVVDHGAFRGQSDPRRTDARGRRRLRRRPRRRRRRGHVASRRRNRRRHVVGGAPDDAARQRPLRGVDRARPARASRVRRRRLDRPSRVVAARRGEEDRRRPRRERRAADRSDPARRRPRSSRLARRRSLARRPPPREGAPRTPARRRPLDARRRSLDRHLRPDVVPRAGRTARGGHARRRRPAARSRSAPGTSSSPARRVDGPRAAARSATRSIVSTTSPRWASTSSTCRRSIRSGSTHRKGRNNTTSPAPDDVGSPWAIGSAGGRPHGGRTRTSARSTTSPRSSTACRDRGIELALDIAFQCSPDHPWVTEHPEWFAQRPDGTIQYAENPPKKYQDIYPFDFESRRLARACGRRSPTSSDSGSSTASTIFRVDNPHTKAFAVLGVGASATIQREHPDAIFLAEAFTRPEVMERLAKIGFNQSYTYFTWRQTAWELREYFEELADPHGRLLPPERLAEHAGHPHRAAADRRPRRRSSAAARSWRRRCRRATGIYGPAFELLRARAARARVARSTSTRRSTSCAHVGPRPPRLASRRCSRGSTGSAASTRRCRRPAHARASTTPTTTALLCYSKTDPADVGAAVLVVVNLDPLDAPARATSTSTSQRSGCPYGATVRGRRPARRRHLPLAAATRELRRARPGDRPAHIFTRPQAAAIERDSMRVDPRAPTLADDPLWYKDAIIYEIHVRAFADSQRRRHRRLRRA